MKTSALFGRPRSLDPSTLCRGVGRLKTSLTPRRAIAPCFGVLQEWQTQTFCQEVSLFAISKVGADTGLDFSDPAPEKSQTKITNDIRIVSQQCELTSAYDSGAASMALNLKK